MEESVEEELKLALAVKGAGERTVIEIVPVSGTVVQLVMGTGY